METPHTIFIEHTVRIPKDRRISSLCESVTNAVDRLITQPGDVDKVIVDRGIIQVHLSPIIKKEDMQAKLKGNSVILDDELFHIRVCRCQNEAREWLRVDITVDSNLLNENSIAIYLSGYYRCNTDIPGTRKIHL